MTKRDAGEVFLLKESLLEKGGEEGGGEGGDAEVWNDAAGNQSNGNEWKSLSRLSERRILSIDAAALHPPSVVEHRRPAAPMDKPPTLLQTAAAALGRNWPILLFYFCFILSICVVFQLIRSIYKDPRILIARYCASTTVLCFIVFLVPFMRGLQGRMYDKLATFARFFNPELHKLLGPVFIIAGTIHGAIWIGCTLQSCADTWCFIEAFDHNATTQAVCAKTLCQPDQRGSLPSFAAAFGAELPADLIKRQSAARSFYYGFVCWTLFAAMSALSVPYVRRRCFEIFYYSHHLFVAAIPAFFLHCVGCYPAIFSFEAKMMVYPCGAICFLYACDKMCNVFARRYISTAVDFIHYSRGNIVELRLKPVPAWPLLHRLASKIPSPFGSHSQREVDAIYFAPGTRMRFAPFYCAPYLQ